MLVSPVRLAALAGAVLLALPAAALAKPRVAVLGLEVIETSGVDPKTGAAARGLTRELRDAAGQDDGKLELATEASKDLLELKLLSDCSDEGRRCMADIGKELKVDVLLYGNIEKTQNGYQVSLKLLDVGSAQMSKTTRDIVPFADATAAGLKTWATTFYSRLSGTPEDGVLVVTANGGGTVYVDGELQTNLVGGSAKITGVTVGHHRVTVEGEAGARKETGVEVVAGKETHLTVELERSDLVSGGGAIASERPAGHWRAAFWVAAGATAVGAAGWTIEAYRYTGLWVTTGPLKQDQLKAVTALNMKLPDGQKLLPSSDACALAATDASIRSIAPAEANAVVSRCHRGESAATMTTAFGVASGLTAVAAAYFYYKGYYQAGESSEAERSAARRARRAHEPIVSFAPAIGRTSVGADLAIEF